MKSEGYCLEVLVHSAWGTYKSAHGVHYGDVTVLEGGVLHRNISCREVGGILIFQYFTGTCQLNADWLRLFL